GRGATEQTLELAANLEQQELMARIDVGDENALARQDGDQPFAREPLQRLADRRAADLEACRQHLLGQDIARLEPKRDNLLLDQAVGLLRQALRARRRQAARRRLPGHGSRHCSTACGHVGESDRRKRVIYVSYITVTAFHTSRRGTARSPDGAQRYPGIARFAELVIGRRFAPTRWVNTGYELK